MGYPVQVPPRAWIVVFAGAAVNLCLGILYAWSIWKANLISNVYPAGTPMTGINEGWTYLSKSDATWAYAICGFTFALFMIPGGRIQDKYGPRIGATLGGLCLAGGCILAGFMKSYTGLVLGFGLLGGIGMGLGYAAATPAAVKWFGPHRRALIVGIVVGGYGAAAIYISPLAKWLIASEGLSASFIVLGVLFAAVVIVAGRLLTWPPADYRPPTPFSTSGATPITRPRDWSAGEMLKTRQFYALVFLFIGAAQSGLLVIANAAPILNKTAASIAFFAANAWILSSFGGVVNASGRVGTGFYSDRIGRSRAYLINGTVSVICLLAMPSVMASGSIPLLFLSVGIVIWQYGGCLALLPALTADFFGSKNLGLNYGLVFVGWGIAFFIPQIAGFIEDRKGSLDNAFYMSAAILATAVVISQFLQRPKLNEETFESMKS